MIFERGLAESRHGKMAHTLRFITVPYCILYVAFERAAQLASCRPRVNDPGPHTKCKYLHEQLSVKGNIRFFR